MGTAASSRKSPLSTAITTTVFTSGNSQAVRLPKEFRVSTKIVEISRRGDEIVLREHPRTVGAMMADLPALSKEEAAAFDVLMKSVKAGLRPLEERDFSWIEETTVPRTGSKAKPTASKTRIKKRA